MKLPHNKYCPFEVLADISSTNEKVEFLKNILLYTYPSKVIKLALDQNKQYNIKKLPEPKKLWKSLTTNDVFNFLEVLASQRGASDEDKQKLADYAYSADMSRDVIRIINKDLKCGVSAKLVNKAKPGFIKIFPYMRCSTTSKIANITYPAYIQKKEDGMFVNMIVENNQVELFTRNGTPVPMLSDVVDHEAHLLEDAVYTGEIEVYKVGSTEPLDRKTGNGIVNKIIKGTLKNKDDFYFHIMFWDAIPVEDFWAGECLDEYQERFQYLDDQLFSYDFKALHCVYTEEVYSYEQAVNFVNEMYGKGFEGAVLKNTASPWKNHTSTENIKLKMEKECELFVESFHFGKERTKYENLLGALVCVSSDGGIKVNVGSGFSDEQRENPADYIGRIVTVKFNDVITRKERETISLFLPRFFEIRYDKDEADSTEYILGL